MADVAAFRDEYRRSELGPNYSGWGHFAFTSVGSLAAILFASSRVEGIRGWEWAVVPATFLFANFAEYFGHKGPMHHLRPGLRLLFQRHTQQHHRFFTAEHMQCTRTTDFKMILFPPVMLLFFLGAIATPVGLLVYFLLTPNAGWLFAATAVGYFLLYEWLHFAYHQPPKGIWVAIPGLARLRRHHQLHHDPQRMDRNFNLTFPIADTIFGTMDRGE